MINMWILRYETFLNLIYWYDSDDDDDDDADFYTIINSQIFDSSSNLFTNIKLICETAYEGISLHRLSYSLKYQS